MSAFIAPYLKTDLGRSIILCNYVYAKSPEPCFPQVSLLTRCLPPISYSNLVFNHCSTFVSIISLKAQDEVAQVRNYMMAKTFLWVRLGVGVRERGGGGVGIYRELNKL